ncbi:MAG: VWA domain-containing protein [Phycisphaerae bacterium]
MTLTDAFAYPWVLPAAALLLPLVWWSWLRRERRPAMLFATVSHIERAGRSWSLKARWALPVLRSLVVLLLVVCVARPRRVDEQTRIKTQGVAIELLVDRSPSMSNADLVGPAGRKQTRLAVVKEAVRRFILGDGDALAGRPSDLLGLTSFARYPDTECPLTWDHRHLIRALDRMRPASPRSDEDGTAIGDALLLAVERIRNIERRFKNKDDFKITSRAIILLTDGQQTYGKYKPAEAAEAAQALGITVYAIGAAPQFEEVPFGFFGTVQQPTPVDEESLRQVAEMTGGRYFRATDANSLVDVYREIDKLERSVIDEQRYYLYEELAYHAFDWAGVRWPPPLLAALILLGLEVFLANTRFRRIP